jgi:hypothetical protein
MIDIEEIRRSLDRAARLDLIAEVAETCYDESDSWDPQAGGFGVQLAYLFYAISDPDGAKFSGEGDERFCRYLGTLFPHFHRIWDFIDKTTGE